MDETSVVDSVSDISRCTRRVATEVRYEQDFPRSLCRLLYRERKPQTGILYLVCRTKPAESRGKRECRLLRGYSSA